MSTFSSSSDTVERPTFPSAHRSGFTLVELMIGTLITSIILVVAFQVLVGERRATEARRQEMNAQQNLRVALDQLSKDIRMAGHGVDEFNKQPRIVDAGPYQIGINADISSGVGGDAAMDAGMQIKLSSGVAYNPGDFPSENLGSLPRYNGGAETVVLGLDANFDGSVNSSDYHVDTHNPQDYALYRSVNGLRSSRLAYGLRGPDAYPDGYLPQPMFSYWGTFGGGSLALWGDSNGDGSLSQTEISNLTPVSVNELDKIIYVDLNVSTMTEGEVAAMGHDHGSVSDPFNYLELAQATRIRPRNIGVNPANLSACGNPPSRPGGVWVQDTPADAGSSITVHWNASSDENGGEEDVTHYFVYRKESSGSWGAAIAQIPAAGMSTYSWANDLHTPLDSDIPVDGTDYWYCVSAWDCKPQESSLSYSAGPVSSQPNGSQPPVLVNVFDTPCDEGEEITVVFNQSPDEASSMVDGYRVFRGPTGGEFLAKTLIGYLAANNSPTYVFLDNVDNNVAGAPPQNDTDYWYTVRAVNDTIVSVDSNELGPVAASDGLSSAQLESVVDVPMDSGTDLVITWTRSTSESCCPNPVTSYGLERKGPLDGAFSEIGDYPTTGDFTYSVQDTNLLAGQPYAYRIATHSLTDVVYSREVTGIPTNNIDLLPPTNVNAEPVACDASGSITVTWNKAYHDNGSGDAEFYRVWRRVQGSGAYGEIEKLPVMMLTTYSYVDNAAGMNPPVIGTTYEYVVTTYNESLGNESGYSNVATCTSSSVPGSPYIYYAMDTPDDDGNSITLKFRKSADDGGCTNTVIRYNIYRSEVWGSYPETPVGTHPATGSYYNYYYDNGTSGTAPENETPYYYMIRAFDGDQESVDSNQRGPVMAIEDAAQETALFHDGFETDMGWTHGGVNDDFQRGNPTAQSQTYGQSDPEDAYLGNNVYGNDIGAPGWNGTYRQNADCWLMSPAIDCSEAENVRLSLQRWLNVEQPIYDKASIQVSGDGTGGPWTTVWENSVEVTDTSWHYMEFDIHNIADFKSDVRVRFRLDTDNSWHYAGWNIDEVDVIGEH